MSVSSDTIDFGFDTITGTIIKGGDSFSVANVASHLASTANPHTVTAAQVGLGSVVNQGTWAEGTPTMVNADGVTNANITPDFLHAACTRLTFSIGGTTKPAIPMTGSMMSAAIWSLLFSMTDVSASILLNGTCKVCLVKSAGKNMAVPIRSTRAIDWPPT